MVKRLVRLLLVIGVIGGVLGLVGCEDREAGPVVPLETSTVRLGGEDFTVELAYRQATRARGLMYREELGGDKGMLFIFRRPREKSFYMKNCLMDIDLVYLDDHGRVTETFTMTVPIEGEALEYYESAGKVKYALELQAGTVERLGIRTGMQVEMADDILTIVAEPD